MSLVVVGSVAYDSIATPTGRRDDVLGGSGTYFSIAAAAFARPALVAVVGEDFRPEDEALLVAKGIELSGLTRAPGKTFRWGGTYHEDMNSRDTLFTELNVFEHFAPVLSAEQRKASCLFLGNIQPTLQANVLEQVDAPRFVAMDTMNLWITVARDELVRVISRVDAIFVNDAEAQQLTGKRSVVLAAREIQAMGPELVVIKRGEHGALVFNGDDTFYAPAFPLERTVDPTGAGDTFAGGFVGYLAASEDFSVENVRRAAIIGALMASFCVEGYSVERIRHIDAAAIRERFAAFSALTRFDAPKL